MFTDKDALPPKPDDSPSSNPEKIEVGCPVIRACADGIRSFVPPSLRPDLDKREAAIAQAESTKAVQMERALHLTQYAVTSCLVEGLRMYNLPAQEAKLSALPALSPATLPQYLATVQDVRATPWNPHDYGANMFRAALLKPLEITEQALELLARGEPAEVGKLLAPTLERLGGMSDMLPLLDNLLKIGTDKARSLASLGRAKATASSGLTFF